MTPGTPVVTALYHETTGSIAYIAEDPATKHAVIIDPVLDFDEKAGRVSTPFADRMLSVVQERGLTVDMVLDTHPHADHFSAAAYLKEQLGVPAAIGAHIVDVQKIWKRIYNLPDFPADGSQWDRLFADGNTFEVGAISGRVMHAPGHTLASVVYIVGDAAFVNDTLFQPDSGTARADFPGGSAASLYDSIATILALPDGTRLFTGHDYRPNGRPAQWESTVGEQRRDNIHVGTHVGGGRSRADFIRLREARDQTLPMPQLILPSLQVNIRGGRLPEPESDGRSYLKIPLGAL